MSAPTTAMHVKVRWSVSLTSESSRLEFAAMLTRSLYSSLALMEMFWFFCLTSRSPESPSPLSLRTGHSALITCLPHMSLSSCPNQNTQCRAAHPQYRRWGLCTQNGCGSDMISGCQMGFILRLLTSTVTYIFPFGNHYVFCLYASNVARDHKCFPVKAGHSLQTADCTRQEQKHIFQCHFRGSASC